MNWTWRTPSSLRWPGKWPTKVSPLAMVCRRSWCPGTGRPGFPAEVQSGESQVWDRCRWTSQALPSGARGQKLVLGCASWERHPLSKGLAPPWKDSPLPRTLLWSCPCSRGPSLFLCARRGPEQTMASSALSLSSLCSEDPWEVGKGGSPQGTGSLRSSPENQQMERALTGAWGGWG